METNTALAKLALSEWALGRLTWTELNEALAQANCTAEQAAAL